MSSNAQNNASKRWNKKQAQISIRVKPELKQAIMDHLKDRNESITSFIVRAINNQILNDLLKL